MPFRRRGKRGVKRKRPARYRRFRKRPTVKRVAWRALRKAKFVVKLARPETKRFFANPFVGAIVKGNGVNWESFSFSIPDFVQGVTASNVTGNKIFLKTIQTRFSLSADFPNYQLTNVNNAVTVNYTNNAPPAANTGTLVNGVAGIKTVTPKCRLICLLVWQTNAIPLASADFLNDTAVWDTYMLTNPKYHYRKIMDRVTSMTQNVQWFNITIPIMKTVTINPGSALPLRPYVILMWNFSSGKDAMDVNGVFVSREKYTWYDQ